MIKLNAYKISFYDKAWLKNTGLLRLCAGRKAAFKEERNLSEFTRVSFKIVLGFLGAYRQRSGADECFGYEADIKYLAKGLGDAIGYSHTF